MKITSLQSLLLLAVIPGSAAFLAKAPQNTAFSPAKYTQESPKVVPSAGNSELSAWHDRARSTTANEIGLLQSDYYFPQNRVGGAIQPYAYGGQYNTNTYNNRLGYGSNTYRNSYGYGNNQYSGPYSNSGVAVRF
jgi:hypothetical protein